MAIHRANLNGRSASGAFFSPGIRIRDASQFGEANWLQSQSVQRQTVLGSTNAIKEGLKAGLGISVLSHLAVQTEFANGLLKTVHIEDGKSLRRDFFVVTHTSRTLSPIAESFLEFLQDRKEAPALSAVL